MSIWGNLLKFIKIFLVHPATEIISNIFYLISFVIIGVLLFKESSNYDDHQILDITQSYLSYEIFNSIKTPSQFHDYFLSLLNKLYTIDPRIEEIPLFIPISPIRFISFINSNDCNTEIFYNKTCVDDPEKFKCVIDYLTKSYNHKCGKKYSDSKHIFEKKLIGHYSNYNIRDAENYIDITKDTYISKYRDKFEEIVQDKRLKALIIQINLKAPSNQNFIDIIFGLEMTNYFTDVKPIFSVYILNDNRPTTKIILSLFIIFLSITAILNGIKFIFEINVKCIWSSHLFYLIQVVFDIVFMVVCLLYISEDKKLNFDINLNEFESHLKYINILWYTKTIYALLVIFFPFRIFSLLSWWKRVFEPLIVTLNILFRMLPSILLSLFFFILMMTMFIFMNYFLYNDTFEYYETMYKSLISTFDIRLLIEIYRRKPASRIFGNLFQSKFTVSNIFFQVIFFYFYFSIIISTLVYAFKKSISIQENKKIGNNYLEKLEEIEKKFKEDKLEEYKNSDLMKKHILWWNLDGKNVYAADISSKYEALIFKNSNQILAFLKYIFAVRPEIQFKKLIYKMNIIIETNNKKFGDKEIRQIIKLAEWLVFVGSKIPIIIYGKIKFENSIIMKIKSIYQLTYFINNDDILKEKLESSGVQTLSISKDNNLIFTPKLKIKVK